MASAGEATTRVRTDRRSDPRARRAGAGRARRGAAVPARRLGDRRPARHVPLAGLGIAGATARHRRQRLRLPRLRHHGGRSPAAPAPATGAARSRQGIDGLWLAVSSASSVAVVADGRSPRPWSRRSALRPTSPSRPCSTCAGRCLGLPAMLVVLAATGVLRGLQDTRTPLVVAAVGAVVNVVLNLVLVYGVRLGIAARRWAPRRAVLMALAVVAVVVPRAPGGRGRRCGRTPRASARRAGRGRRCSSGPWRCAQPSS